MKLVVVKQNEAKSWLDREQGIDTITLEGNRLGIEGWFDTCAGWNATVILLDEQLQELRDALR